MRGGIRNRRIGYATNTKAKDLYNTDDYPNPPDNDIFKNTRFSNEAKPDLRDDIDDGIDEIDDTLYDHNGAAASLSEIRRQTAPYVPERTTEQVISEVEKKAWVDKIKAMSPGERAIALTAFEDVELLDEIERRLKSAKFSIKRMRDALEVTND